MTKKLILDYLPAELIAGLGGVSAPSDQATLLQTVDGNGYVRVALLSRSEIFVIDQERIAFVVWVNSSTAANLRSSLRGTLYRVDGGTPRSVRLRCQPPVPAKLSDGMDLLVVRAQVEEVLADSVAYAAVTSGVSFTVRGEPAVRPRWQETSRLLEQLGAT